MASSADEKRTSEEVQEVRRTDRRLQLDANGSSEELDVLRSRERRGPL